MQVSPIASGHQILQTSQRMSSEAATNINKATLPTASTTSLSATVSAPTKPDAVSDAVKLVQAQNLNQIGANVIERSNNMTGTLLNISV